MPQIFPWIEQPCLQYERKDPVDIKDKNPLIAIFKKEFNMLSIPSHPQPQILCCVSQPRSHLFSNWNTTSQCSKKTNLQNK